MAHDNRKVRRPAPKADPKQGLVVDTGRLTEDGQLVPDPPGPSVFDLAKRWGIDRKDGTQ